jgi:hypothetical protein
MLRIVKFRQVFVFNLVSWHCACSLSPVVSIVRPASHFTLETSHTRSSKSILMFASHHPAPSRVDQCLASAALVDVTILGNPDIRYRVSLQRIRHLPRFPAGGPYTLCPLYDPRESEGSCILGWNCVHVHADCRDLSPIVAHANFAWRCLSDVTYPRYPESSSTLVTIAAPNSRTYVDVMHTSCLLVTRALESKRRPLAHCAHYYLNRRCALGADCRFVHSVFRDSTAHPGQRAPAPIQLGRAVPASRHNSFTDHTSPQAATHRTSPSGVRTSSRDDFEMAFARVSPSFTSDRSTPECTAPCEYGCAV